MSRHRHMVS
ncbi:gp 0.3B, partial [Enterobacteria phage 3/7]